MDVKPKINFNQIIFLGIFILAIFLAYRIILTPASDLLLILGGAMAVIIIVWKPIFGLAAYMLIYPVVPAEEVITSLKIAMFGLFILILASWMIHRILLRGRVLMKREYLWLYVFFLFLCFSPLLGIKNDFTMTDWARDIAPLLNLLLVPIMVDYFEDRQSHWLLYLVFVPIGLGVTRDILVLLGDYGISFESLSVITLLPLPSIHPSLGFTLGLLMYLQKARRRRLWLIFCILSLVVAFLTPTRTVWITTVTMAFLIIAFSSRKRFWAIGAIIILVAAVGWLVYFETSSSTYIESQRQRFQGLIQYQYDLSYENRAAEIQQTRKLFMSSPLHGVGFGYEYDFWRPFVTGIGPGLLNTNFTHNDIMFIASKGGIIGLTLFMLMQYGFLKKLFQRRKEKPHSLQAAWATFAILMIINSLIIGLSTPVYQTRWATFMLAILLAFGLAYKQSEPDAEERRR